MVCGQGLDYSGFSVCFLFINYEGFIQDYKNFG